MIQAQNRQKQYYDQTAKNYEFAVGDRVWLYTPAVKKGKTQKLSRLWKGPFRIVEVFSPNVRIIPVDAPRQQSTVVHINRIKPCYDSHVPNPTNVPTIETETNEGENQQEDNSVDQNLEQEETAEPVMATKKSDEGRQLKNNTIIHPRPSHKYSL